MMTTALRNPQCEPRWDKNCGDCLASFRPRRGTTSRTDRLPVKTQLKLLENRGWSRDGALSCDWPSCCRRSQTGGCQERYQRDDVTSEAAPFEAAKSFSGSKQIELCRR